MGKILITADIHNGIPGKLDDTLWAMKIMSDYAEKHDIKKVLVLGDLFHDRVNLNIEVYSRVYDLMEQAKEKQQEWICFPGNHDMYLKNSWDVNSVHPLRHVMKVIENTDIIKLYEQRFHILPFVHREQEYMEILSELNQAATEDDIMLTHIGVSGATMNICFLIQNWNTVNFSQTKYKRIYTGHFHCHQQVGEKLWYPGSPIPFRFDEGEADHGFIIYDTEENEHQFIKTFDIYQEFSDTRPPDYITIVDTDIEELAEIAKDNKVKVLITQDHTSNELLDIKKALEDEGAITVKFGDQKEAPEENKVQDQIQNSGKIEDIFQSWIDNNSPKWADRDTMLACFEDIRQEAEEKYTAETEDD